MPADGRRQRNQSAPIGSGASGFCWVSPPVDYGWVDGGPSSGDIMEPLM